MTALPPPPAGAGPAAVPGEPATGAALARAVTAQCLELLRDTYLPRLESALAELPPQDLWWRPHARATSAGHLLQHLSGNIRQWIVSGLGSAPDLRDRAAEFAAPEAALASQPVPGAPPDAAALLAALAATVLEACAIIERLDAAALLAPVTIQGFDTNGLGAMLHVTEHMSWHTGQIAWIAKLRAGERHALAYYDDAALAAHRPGASASAPRDDTRPSRRQP